MDQEEFNAHTLRTLHDLHSLTNKLANRECCTRALLLALADQPALQRQKLMEDFEDNLQRIWEQVPPDLQDAEIYRSAQAELQDRLTPPPHRAPGTS